MRAEGKGRRWTLYICDKCGGPGWRFCDRKCSPAERTHQGRHGGPVEVMPVSEHEQALATLRAKEKERLLEELLGDEAVEAAGKAASAEHSFRPYDGITRTLFKAAIDSLPTEGREQ